jgi:CheY-like chemotaxis protein
MEAKRLLYFADSNFPSVLHERIVSRGYALEPVTDGDELFDRISSLHPALVIAFAKMPGMDGLSLCRQVKGNPSLNDVAILVLSNRKENVRHLYYAAGCDGYYEAPFDDIGIAQRVDEILLNRSSARKLSLTRLVIDYRVNSDLLSISPENLQEGTIFLRANNPLEEGARLKLTVSMAGKTLLDAYGEVIRSEPFRGASSRPSGMAVRLYDLDPATETFLAALTRQQMLAARTWSEIHVEALVDRIERALTQAATQPTSDPILQRAGFDRARLRPWEATAFHAGESESDLEVVGALREAVALIHKIRYHRGRYREFVFFTTQARQKLSAHSEQVLARADAAIDVLASLSQRLTSEGRAEDGQHLATTQGELLQEMVELRTVMGDAKRLSELTAATVAEEDLCPEPEVQNTCRGLVELFDFSAGGRRHEYAALLNPELDLSDLTPFEIVCFMEGRQLAAAVHPTVGAWTRALAVRALQISEFLRYRKPGREVRPDRVEEVIQFSVAALDALLQIQDRYRAEMPQLIGAPGVAPAHLEELAETNHRALKAGAHLSAYFNLHAPPGAPDYNPRLVAAAEAAAKIVKPRMGGPLPVGVVSAGSEKDRAAERASSIASPAVANKEPQNEKPRPLLERLGPAGEWLEDLLDRAREFGLRRLGIIGGLVLLVAAAAIGVYLGFFASPSGGPGGIDLRPFAGILPLTSCEIRKPTVDSERSRTLQCTVKPEWLKKPEEERKESLRKLQEAARARKLKFDKILLVDPGDYTVGFAENDEIEVFAR